MSAVSALRHCAEIVDRLARAVYLRLLFLTGLLRWAKSQVAKRGTIVITLHRVLPDSEYKSAAVPRGMALRVRTFEGLLKYLGRACDCVLLEEGEPGMARSKPDLPQVAITFDDGWKDNFEIAFPVARKYGLPFTVFVCPKMIPTNGNCWNSTATALWWAARRAGKLTLVRTLAGGAVNGSVDKLIENLGRSTSDDRETFLVELESALKPYTGGAPTTPGQLLNWPQAKQMSEAGVAFGSHSNTHPVLTQIPLADARKELSESKTAIETELKSCRWFAYPEGESSAPVRALASQAGYRHAFTNSPGVWEQKTDPFEIPRVNLWEGNLTGAAGRFSRAAAEYAIFWKAYRAS